MRTKAGIRLLRLVLLFSLGCGTGNSRVTGTVTFDGKPVSEGVILLNDIEGRLGPDSGRIEDGKFDFEAKPGRKRVEIRASREVPQKRTEMGAYFEDYIPRRYNSQSALVVEIVPSGKNHWDFQLERDKK